MRCTVFPRLLLAVAAMAILSVGDAFSVTKVATVAVSQSRAPSDHFPRDGKRLPSPAKLSSIQLQATSNTPEGDDETTDLFSNVQSNLVFGALYVAFLSFAFIFSPGEIGADVDNTLIQSFIENPTSPAGFNELFFAVFNLLGVMPLVMSQLVFPQGSKKGLPATPFCLASVAMGYFALGTLFFVSSEESYHIFRIDETVD
jgi:hypothetical protein